MNINIIDIKKHFNEENFDWSNQEYILETTSKIKIIINRIWIKKNVSSIEDDFNNITFLMKYKPHKSNGHHFTSKADKEDIAKIVNQLESFELSNFFNKTYYINMPLFIKNEILFFENPNHQPLKH